MHGVPVTALQDYLQRAIPLYSAMHATTRGAGTDRVVLAAPLAPNVNHQGTAFGGSIAALATLACWGWLWTFLRDAGPDARLVVARSEIDYLRPVASDFTARCEAPDGAALTAFSKRFAERGRAHIELAAAVEDAAGVLCARYRGQFSADNRKA